MMTEDFIELKNVSVHNLKNVDLNLHKNRLTVFTGVSGSGKSSMAFDTIYMEGQRRYIESLPSFARRQMSDIVKPDVKSVTGISPTISIEQKTVGRNPRSTVGTLTEVYDYLRVLFARVGTAHCPESNEVLKPQSRESIISAVLNEYDSQKIIIFAPIASGKKGEFKEQFLDLQRRGFTKVRVNGELFDLFEDISLDPSAAHSIEVVIDRLSVTADLQARVAESITLALEVGAGACSVKHYQTEKEQLFSTHAFSQKSGKYYYDLEPQDFSFNSPAGMCPKCMGLGKSYEFCLDKIIEKDKSIAEDCCALASSYDSVRFGNIYRGLARKFKFKVDAPWKKLSKKAQDIFLYGTEDKWTSIVFIHPVTKKRWTEYVHWRGVVTDAHTKLNESKSESYKKKLQSFMTIQPCNECKGARIKRYPAATTFAGQKIHDITAMTIKEAFDFFSKLKLTGNQALIATELLKEITERLKFLTEVGLHYLTLERTAPTLSGGEAQRVRLASQIGSGLVGITYILDEPSIGLHPSDNIKLIATLKHLRDLGNTLIVVEHDEETILSADEVVDFGPLAGENGGQILAAGSLKELLKNESSVTASYLTGRSTIPFSTKRRGGNGKSLIIEGAKHHNLKNVTATIPLGKFVAVTGLSGSGKSSLISEILYPALSNALHRGEHEVGLHKKITGIEEIDKIIAIDQSPIGRSPRSNPATYVRIFDEIRDLFSQLPQSQARGYKPGRFSFNVKEGSCANCSGMGQVKVDMDFMQEAWTNCPECLGKRFDSETLSVLFKGKNINDILEMEVSEALEIFADIPSLKNKLETLTKVGLGYIKLGQSSLTLSGGEAQRIKLAKELVRPSTGKTVYILDEPTTGLHFHDINQLLKVLHALVDKGNTVVVIEHNMDLVKTVDWIIDMGPGGGADGGQLVAAGTPEKIAKINSPTGEAVKKQLDGYYQLQANKILAAKAKRKPKFVKNIDTPITVLEAEQNNLKKVSLEIPREQITVITGPSGSGKSSLAFDTIYAEGQRRYVESLSPYMRQFVATMPKPVAKKIAGLSPSVAIEQKIHAGNPRSTVGTMTEIYDYLRILYARVGIAHCPETGEVIEAISKEYVVEKILNLPLGSAIHILAPLKLEKNETETQLIHRLIKFGFTKIRVNKEQHFIEELISGGFSLNKKQKYSLELVVDRLKVNPSMKMRLYEAVENAARISHGQLKVLLDDQEIDFNLQFTAKGSGRSYSEITPHTFSFNSQSGMCPDCNGLGYQYGANLLKNEAVLGRSLLYLVGNLWAYESHFPGRKFLLAFLEAEKIDPYVPLRYLTPEKLKMVLFGSPEGKYYQTDGLKFRWQGINESLAKYGKNSHKNIKERILPILEQQECFGCNGARINALARHVTISDLSLPALCQMPMEAADKFIHSIKIPAELQKLLSEVMLQLESRLKFIIEVGLGYLSLDRMAPTLSGGEWQRIRLARQLGSGMTGVLYVLDEPTIGLHPADNLKLNQALLKLKQQGNTLVIVEHDPLTVQIADKVIDMGPASGNLGGEIVSQGTFKEILADSKSLSGKYFAGKLNIGKISPFKPSRAYLTVESAIKNNLKNVSLKIEMGKFTCFTGVSGSGKSTMLRQIMLPALQKGITSRSDEITTEFAKVTGLKHFSKCIFVDQSPIGQTSRSDISSYTDLLMPLRFFFAQLPAARAQGMEPRNFSPNQKRGMCTTCSGHGYKSVEMHFLPAVKVVCEDCKGKRLNPQSLQITYKDKSLADYLDMSCDQLIEVFADHPHITRILQTLQDVGLGYLHPNQETATLSGGESQRLKLSFELSKRTRGKTIYLLDEPTTGLHMDDIAKLMKIFEQLLQAGATIVAIEHQTDVIAAAHQVIDFGPKAGAEGGEIVFNGTPAEMARDKKSVTGKYL